MALLLLSHLEAEAGFLVVAHAEAQVLQQGAHEGSSTEACVDTQ
jgi:hypothetical protein